MYLDGSADAECFTLEPPYRMDGTKPRAIPVGTYPLTIRWSVKFGKHVPHVENVPGFVAIEVHWGNYPRDTDGCTLVGRTRGPLPDFIGSSVLAWTMLMAKLMAVAELTNPSSPEQSQMWNVGEITYI